MAIVLTINREQFILRTAEAISRVRTDIEDAVRSGGRLVVVGDAVDSPEVLITPSTVVRIDLVGADGTGRPEPEPAPEFIDFDQYL